MPRMKPDLYDFPGYWAVERAVEHNGKISITISRFDKPLMNRRCIRSRRSVPTRTMLWTLLFWLQYHEGSHALLDS